MKFELSAEQEKGTEEWKKQLNELFPGKILQFAYIFMPTHIGTALDLTVTISDKDDSKRFITQTKEFTDYGNW